MLSSDKCYNDTKAGLSEESGYVAILDWVSGKDIAEK